MSHSNCKICLQDKPKIYKGLTKHSSGIYEDDRGRKWLGKVCPDCIKVMFKDRRSKGPLEAIDCKVCGVSFTPVRTNQKLCSSKACKDKRDPKRTPINLGRDDMKE